jgi:hypothetical protein
LFIKNDFFNEFFLDFFFDFLLVELGGNGLVKLGFGGLKFHTDFILFSLSLFHLLFSPLYGLNAQFLLYFLLDFLPIDLFLELFLPFHSILLQNGLSLGFVLLEKFFFGVILDIFFQFNSFPESFSLDVLLLLLDD